MKASKTARKSLDDEPDQTEGDAGLAAEGATSHEAARQQSHPRPGLVRSPPARLAEVESAAVQDRTAALTSSKGDTKTPGKQPVGGNDGGSDVSASKPQIMRVVSETEDEKLAKLKEAVNAKLMLQQRKRSSYGPSLKRVSPIREEEQGQMSPSLTAAFASPNEPAVRAPSTVSTESMESAKTVRASVPPTPAEGRPLRTPSYPFPYVPGTPRTWSSSFHQPFTSLSPTVSHQQGGDHDTPGRASIDMMSGGSTPAANAFDFLPQGDRSQMPADPRFPSPNLYDLVLQLNTEPGLEQWWATVTNLMHDHFKAERATLVLPLDPTDIENVPWGQKATFSMNGREEFVSHRTVVEQTATGQHSDLPFRTAAGETLRDFQMAKLHPERLRPKLDSRHSYAGPSPSWDPRTSAPGEATNSGGRPKALRTMTHGPGMTSAADSARAAPQRFPSSSSVNVRHTSISDPDFSSIAGGVDAGPYAEVFPTVRALDHEVRPLIEPGGVNRVLDRGKVVTVTRDYVLESSESNTTQAASESQAPEAQEDITPKDAPNAAVAKLFGSYRSVFASENPMGMRRDYEEYEQYPTSPWAQSPAPSPAIHADEETNPFFSSEEQQIEESFEPAASTPKDYSQLGQVEAIGIDRASTVIHVPLVHPSLSQPMQSLRMRQSSDRPGPPRRSDTVDMERKAPIAILSLLTSTVPFPPNLTRSLTLLGPHLATSFATAQQFSSTHANAVTIRHRRTASGHLVTNAPMTIEPTSLEDIVHADLEETPGSISGSITSPSDYSGRSRHSPAGSIVGTPGWDPAAHGWSTSKSVVGTPAISGTEMVDNYFEAKKRSAQRGASGASFHNHTTPAKTPSKATASGEAKHSARKSSPTRKEDSTPQRGQRERRPSKDDRSPLPPREKSPPRMNDNQSPARPGMRHSASHFVSPSEADAARRHSLLHSYGADFDASFGAASSTVTSGFGAHVRKASYSDDMPPPSERLLRTIIDCVPVQIFTAKPDTGQLSWVNSKFLIYRGQEPRQVLGDPWQAIHPDDRAEFLSSWHRSLRTAQQLQQKVRLERFDGSFRWFYVRAAPLKDKRQKIVHWIGTMMDFHEQHLAELNAARQQETEASEAKYRALANSSPQIVFAVSRKKGVIFCNSQWLHYSGQTEQQALGLGFTDHVHPEDLIKCKLPSFDSDSSRPTNVPTSLPTDIRLTDTASAASSSGSSETEKGSNSSDSSPVAAALPQRKLSELADTGILRVSRDADGRPFYSTEVRLRSKEGEYRWHLVRVLLAEPQRGSGLEEETWYGTCTDINDHKTLERDLKETMDEKSRFLSNMSHEIRTPLNGIMGMVNFLIDSSLTSEQMEHVNIIRASTEGLRGLINDILDLSKAEAGMIQLSYDWLYVRALIEEVNDLTSAMAIDKGLELNYIVEEDVPAQVKGDRFRVRQILLNVIGNAIKFTQQGEVFVRCSILKAPDELAKDEMFIKFEIVDTGRGFTEKEAEHLFKRFSQIDGSSTRQHGGTGLGLVISRQLAQLHGGDMSAKGSAGKGATFTFFIKIALPSIHDQPPPPATPGGPTFPILPALSGFGSATPTPVPRTKSGSAPSQAKPSPKFHSETTSALSPFGAPLGGRDSPSASSASSDPSLKSGHRTDSLRSERSSASSYVPEPAFASPSLTLSLPEDVKRSESSSTDTEKSGETAKALSIPAVVPTSPTGAMSPPLFSILVACPLKYSREATVQHIDKTVPSNIPHQITAREHLHECQMILGGEDPMRFTHVVVVFQDVGEIVSLLDQIMTSPAHSGTMIVIITNLAQRKKIMEQAPNYDYEKLSQDRRVRFVFKPLKPSRFAVIFDPQKEREMSTDRNQDSAQAVAVNQKQVFEELKNRLGNRDKRVLLVEDNRVNQMVGLPHHPPAEV